jgi:hypothetical protein
LLLLLTLAFLFVGENSVAQRRDVRKEKPTSQSEKPKGDSGSGMTKSREAAALAFVREHHGELESLLVQLKESQPKQYETAIRDLFRASERLAGFQEKDRERHDLELKAWQAKSRVQLLSATLLMSPSDAQLKDKLKRALLDDASVRREILELERDRITRRLARLEAQIQSIDAGAERTAERQIKLLLEGTKKSIPTKTTNSSTN